MPNANTPKLNHIQLIILSCASQRTDGFALAPEGVKAAAAGADQARSAGLAHRRGREADRAQDHESRLCSDPDRSPDPRIEGLTELHWCWPKPLKEVAAKRPPLQLNSTHFR